MDPHSRRLVDSARVSLALLGYFSAYCVIGVYVRTGMVCGEYESVRVCVSEEGVVRAGYSVRTEVDGAYVSFEALYECTEG